MSNTFVCLKYLYNCLSPEIPVPKASKSKAKIILYKKPADIKMFKTALNHLIPSVAILLLARFFCPQSSKEQQSYSIIRISGE